MNKTQQIKERRTGIAKAIEQTRLLKSNLQKTYSILENKYEKGIISYIEFRKAKAELLKGRSLNAWIKYYDECIEYYRQESAQYGEKTTKNYKPIIAIVLIVTLLLTFLLFTAISTFTGFNIISTINGNDTIIANISEETGFLNFTTGGTVMIDNTTNVSTETPPIEEIPEENLSINLPQEEIQNETSLDIPESAVNETSAPEQNETVLNQTESYSPSSDANIISEQTVQYGAIIGRPVLWKKTISYYQETNNISISLPEGAQEIHVKEIVDGREQELTNISESNGLETISGNVIRDAPQNIWKNILSWFTRLFDNLGITGHAIAADITEDTTTKTTTKTVKLVSDTSVKDIVVEYSTEAPETFEEETSSGKLVTVSSASDIHYDNVLTYANITDTALEDIKLYWLVNDTKQDFAFDGYDSNEDGLVDYIEWITPHLSNETFQIILITNATHLDNNRTYMTDIYPEVKEQDNNWSEKIYSGEYVRVRFEQNLTQDKDIKLYVRNTNQTNTTVQIYTEDSSELLAEYPIITTEGYYTMFLTNLTDGNADTFDLKINGASAADFLEFDYIVDPTIILNSGGVGDIGISPLSNTSYVIAWSNQSSNFMEYAIYNTSGTIIKGPNRIGQNGTDALSRVAVTTINSTAFAIAWINSSTGVGGRSEIRMIFNTSGVNITGPMWTDGAVGTTNDLSLAQTKDRFAYCVVDIIEGDFDFWSYNSTTGATITAEVGIDATMLPSATDNSHNIIACSAMNDTKIAMAWIKRGSVGTSNITVTLRTAAGALPTGVTDRFIANFNAGTGNANALNGSVDLVVTQNRYIATVYNHPLGNNLTLNIQNGSAWGGAGAVNVSIDTNLGIGMTRLATTALTNGSNKGYVAIAYWTNGTGTPAIKGVVYDEYGILATAPFTIDATAAVNDTAKLMDAAGKEFNGNTTAQTPYSLCEGTWALAYTNRANVTQVQTLLINGSAWNGICPVAVAANNPPVISFQIVNTTNSIQNYTNGTVNVSFSVSDLDGNPLRTQIDWYLNGNLNMSFANQTNISIANTTRGDNFTAIVAVFDGTAWGTNATGTVLIRNAPPEPPNIHIPNNGTTMAAITGLEISNTTDIDGDKINYTLIIDNNEAFTSPEWTNFSIKETANTTTETSTIAIADGLYFWKANATDGLNSSDYSHYKSFTKDATGPVVSGTAINTTNVTTEGFVCINATVTDALTPINTVKAEIANSTQQKANWTMTDTGPWCSGIASDNKYGVELQLTASGNWTVNTTWATDLVPNEGRDSYVNLQINVTTTAQAEVAPTITQVSLNDTRSIIVGGIRTIEFSAIVNDTNGNINASSVIANVTLSGQALRANSTCLRVSGDGTGANFTCTVGMEFYDAAGDWRVTVEAQDNASNFAINNSRYFTLQETVAMNISSAAMSFPGASPGMKNITSPGLSIQNIGNKIYLNTSVTGINLLGDTNSATSIPAANFTVSNATGSANPQCTSTAIFGAALVNNTAVNIEGANTSRGALATNNLYFCITGIPLDLITQTYSTGGTPDEDDWTILVA
ncbi:hypothetical protein HZA98_00040 [Candidatus Woesearchaeota archaeon]|nr:hypothetical protein [Candidatus Woesearchaeota archaeon]